MGSVLLRRIRLIFNSLLLSQAVFLGVSFLVLYGGYSQPVPEVFFPVLWLTVPLVTASMLVFTLIFYRFQVRRAQRVRMLASRLRIYFYAVTIRMAVLNGVNLFTVAVFLMTGEPLFLLLFISATVYFFQLRPSARRCVRDMRLPAEEARRFFPAGIQGF